MTAPEVLLIEGDVKLLRLVEATLRLGGIEAVATESAEEALHALRSMAPSLVLTASSLPDLGGIDLLRRVRSMPGLGEVPFLFLAGRIEAEAQARRLPHTRTLRKPFSIDELLTLTRTILAEARDDRPQPDGDLAGDLSTHGVPDVLRMLVVQRQTGTLSLVLRATQARGVLFVEEGQVVAAEFGLLRGVPALFALLPHDEGSYGFVAGPVTEEPTVLEATLPLMMEGYRLLDEGLLRRIDPREAAAARMFEHLVDRYRQATPLAVAASVSLPTGRTAVELPSLREDFDDVGVDTADFAPAFLTAELDAIEAELDAEFEDAAATIGMIVVEEPYDDDVTAIALVDDTMAEMEVVAGAGGSAAKADTLDVMDFYEMLKAEVVEELGAAAVQLGTRTGRVITSSIPEAVRRDTVAAFSREAIQFASRDPDGTQFASLDAGDLHVLVVEVDHLRLLTILFDRQPDPLAVLRMLRPHVQDYRELL